MTPIPEIVMSTAPTIRNTSPCPICGACDYEWGFIKEGKTVRYLAGESGFLAAFALGELLTARNCRECGHVALFHPKSRS